jgi:catechol 2,3-dioxygenase-like lactoylglutathione lyase family enzyme
MFPQPLIAVHDVESTSAWYQAVLGFTSGHGGSDYEQLMSEGRMVMQLHRWGADEHPYLGRSELRPHGNGVVLWFLSSEVEHAYARAREAGAEVLEPIAINPNANHLEFWVRDPNGYIVVVAGHYGEHGAYAANGG